MKIGILGAFSRYNYGDVLMPLIVEKAIRQRISGNIDFSFYSYVKSDLSRIGGVPSNSLHDLYSNYKNLDCVIVAGGQVFGQEHRRMYPLEFNMSHPELAHYLQIIFKVCGKISPSQTNKFCRRMINVSCDYPWVVEAPFNGNKVIYNTVGGNFDSLSHTKSYPSIINTLSESPILSVRSYKDYRIWKTHLNNVTLVPDSVGIISEIYPTNSLLQLLSSHSRNLIPEIGDYFVFQIAREYGEGKEQILANEIHKACDLSGLNCLLLPMGYAAGHEDQIILNSLNNITDERVKILDNANIFDITYALSCAKAYIGTSLHGAIVSCSYSVPHSTIVVNNKKTEDYIKGWVTSNYPSTAINSIAETLCNLISEPNVKYTSYRSSEISNLIDLNFDNIVSVLAGFKNA